MPNALLTRLVPNYNYTATNQCWAPLATSEPAPGFQFVFFVKASEHFAYGKNARAQGLAALLDFLEQMLYAVGVRWMVLQQINE
jgi:hypothetical protein